MFIDTHCHLSIEDYDNIDLVISENRLNSIDKIIVSACTKDSIVESLVYAKKYNDVYLTVGYHPSEVDVCDSSSIDFLKNVIMENKKIVGIGEIGLDYHYGSDDVLVDKQKNLFRKQMQLAQDLNLPVVIHSRDATLDTINILKEFPKVHGVIHCFSGSVETAKEYIAMGYKIGIGGVVTFKNSKLSNVVSAIGISNILLETDSPYLTPEPYRGLKNSSKYIPIIASFISRVLSISLEDVSKITLKNAYEVFDLK